MRNKLIASGAALLGYGALIGWAITADHYSSRERDYQDLVSDKTDHIFDLKDRNDRLFKFNQDLNGRNRELEATVRSRLVEKVKGGEHLLPADYDDAIAEIFGEPEPSVDNDLIETDGALELFIRPSSDLVVDEAVETLVIVSEPIDEDDDEDVYVVPEGETVEETRSNLQNLIEKYTQDEDQTASFNELIHKDVALSSFVPPRVITQASFAYDDEGEFYDKVTLTYFPGDRVLLDEEEDPIDLKGIDHLVTWKALSSFGEGSEDPNVVFVRNSRLEIDYEIIRDEENQLPAHVRFGLGREEFAASKASGLIRFRPEDE